jgi:sigma-E factor negative regulatory protein RseC
MEEFGIVKKIDGNIAVVTISKKGFCESCTLGLCKSSEESMEINALNHVNAQIGQKVKILIKPYSYIKGSILIYGIPAISFVLGIIIGREIFGIQLGIFDPDSGSAFLGFGALALSLILVKIWSSKLNQKSRLLPVIKKIIE